MNAQMPAAASTAAVAVPIYKVVLFPLGACSEAISVVSAPSANGSSVAGSEGGTVVGSVL